MFATRLSTDAQTALGLLAPLLPPHSYLAVVLRWRCI